MDTDEKKTIHFALLGSFSLGYAAGGENVSHERTGKKALSFLQYLIVNHGRSISLEELVEQFWPEETGSNDPENALKNMIFRVRSYLTKVFPEQKGLIQKRPGCYIWNPDIGVEVDAERFEQAYLEARRAVGKERERRLLDAVALYKGDFLAGNDSDWVIPLRHYYQTLYLDACKEVLAALQEEEQWTKMIAICEQAYGIDFSSEAFIIYHMQALTALGQQEKAIERYQMFRRMLWQEYEMEPSADVEWMYALASSMCRNRVEGQDILKLVSEAEEEKGAFFCTLGVFKNIVALERRHIKRSKQDTTLVAISLEDRTVLTADAGRLQRILRESLRTGDLVTRLDAGSYIVMLPGASAESARAVIRRVEQSFRKKYAGSDARIAFRTAPLKPMG